MNARRRSLLFFATGSRWCRDDHERHLFRDRPPDDFQGNTDRDVPFSSIQSSALDGPLTPSQPRAASRALRCVESRCIIVTSRHRLVPPVVDSFPVIVGFLGRQRHSFLPLTRRRVDLPSLFCRALCAVAKLRWQQHRLICTDGFGLFVLLSAFFSSDSRHPPTTHQFNNREKRMQNTREQNPAPHPSA